MYRDKDFFLCLYFCLKGRDVFEKNNKCNVECVLKDYNINLSMFIKIIDEKTAMILLAEKEIFIESNEQHIIIDAVNLSNIYKEKYGDVAFSDNKEKLSKAEIEEILINRLERIVKLKIYTILENYIDSIKDIV